MHHLRIERVLGHRQRARERVHRTHEPRIRPSRRLLPLRIATHHEPALGHVLLAEAAHLDRDPRRQSPAQILDMHAGAAIHVRRIFLGEESHFSKIGHRMFGNFGR